MKQIATHIIGFGSAEIKEEVTSEGECLETENQSILEVNIKQEEEQEDAMPPESYIKSEDGLNKDLIVEVNIVESSSSVKEYPEIKDEKDVNGAKSSEIMKSLRSQTQKYKEILNAETDTNRKVSSRTSNKRIKCDICQCTIRKGYTLNTHICKQTGGKPYKCIVCDTSFRRRSDLSKHSRTHTGEKPYKCDICHKTFKQFGHLKTHLRIHTGEKPYKCNICGESFRQCANLKEHVRIHTGEKPFKCDTCYKCFTQFSTLRKHVRTHSTEKPLSLTHNDDFV